MTPANARGQQLELRLRSHAHPRLPRLPRRDFRADLDRLVDAYRILGKQDAVLSVTREQERLIRTFMAYPSIPLTYRGHRVVIVAEPEKR